MSRVIENIHFLYCLSDSTSIKKLFLIIDWASKHHIEAVCEICVNILHTDLELTADFIQKLKKHKKNIRFLASREIPIKHKKRLLKKSLSFIKLFKDILNNIYPLIPQIKKKPVEALK